MMEVRESGEDQVCVSVRETQRGGEMRGAI